jgi:hypothetical protein
MIKIDSNLFRESIVDAKAMRAAALANAKQSLEENFTKRFEAVFADKLQQEAAEEEEEQQEEGMNEVEAPNQVHGKGGEAKGPKTKAVSKGNPKKGSAAKKDFKTIAVGGSEGAAGSKAPAAKQSIVNETEEEEQEEGKEMDENCEEEQQEEGKMNEAGLTSEDLDEIIKELEMEVANDAEGDQSTVPPSPEDEVPTETNDETPPPTEVPTAPPDNGEEAPPVDIEAEPGSEIEVEPGAEAEVEPVPGDENIPGEEQPQQPSPESGDEEEIDLEELISALNEEEKEEEEEEENKEEKLDEISNDGVPMTDQVKSGTKKTAYPKTTEKCDNTNKKSGIENTPGLKEVEDALQESYKTIEYLRGQINEVNLLNAKLLYTNRLFKEFSSNLDDSYRMKIVEAFDLTKTVREVKLAYALLAESLSFGVKGMKKSSETIIKKTIPSSTVKHITEGLASKPVASTKPSKELISEGVVNEMAARFKKLAGIKEVIKENKK